MLCFVRKEERNVSVEESIYLVLSLLVGPKTLLITEIAWIALRLKNCECYG